MYYHYLGIHDYCVCADTDDFLSLAPIAGHSHVFNVTCRKRGFRSARPGDEAMIFLFQWTMKILVFISLKLHVL